MRRPDRHQQLVARAVAEAVVDRLEVVQVDEHQRQLGARALSQRDLAAEQFAQQRAVGQARQVVEHRHAVQLLVLGLELRDQLANLGVHRVQVLAQLAELVAAQPVLGRHGLACRQVAGLRLQAVDGPQQPVRQHAREHQHAEQHLHRHQSGRELPAVAQLAFDLGAVEPEPDARHGLALVQDGRLLRHGLLCCGAVAALQDAGQRGGVAADGLQVQHLHAADRRFGQHAGHGLFDARPVQRPGRLGHGRAGQGQDGRAVALHQGFLGVARVAAVDEQHGQRRQHHADDDRRQQQGADRPQRPPDHGRTPAPTAKRAELASRRPWARRMAHSRPPGVGS